MDDSVSFIAKEASPAQYSHSLHERTHSEKQKRDFTITEKQDEFKKMLKENPEVAQRFVLNSKLVDFKNIPVELCQKVVDGFYSLKNW